MEENNFNLDDIEKKDDDKLIRFPLETVINRINFFNKFYSKLDNVELVEIYDWFLYSNLLNLYTFSDKFKLHNNEGFNIDNPFYIWTYYFNMYKHFDKAKETARNMIESIFMKKNLEDFKYKKRKEFQNNTNISILEKLIRCFYNNIINSWKCIPNTNEINLIKEKIKSWNEIKEFLQFILDELPENNVFNPETDFYKNRFQLWRFYLTKTKNK